jgi:hypothetical protein
MTHLTAKSFFKELNPKDVKDIFFHLNYKHPDKKILPFHKTEDYAYKGVITEEGKSLINNIINLINNRIDKYPIYSLSSDDNNILLWSHYTDSHKGFCIEFKNNNFNTSKITYDLSVPSLKLINILLTKDEQENIQKGHNIKKALLTKLINWEYENEYRIIDPFNNNLSSTKTIDKITYTSDTIESIIFGSRMPEKSKAYIIRNMPYEVQFKQAFELDSSIEIRPYKP